MTTAGNFGTLTVLWEDNSGGCKKRGISCLGPATYTGTTGSELDLSSDATDGLGNGWDAFAAVYHVALGGVSPAASTKYRTIYVPAAAGAPATGRVRIIDDEQATPAEPSGDLSGTTFYFVVMGR